MRCPKCKKKIGKNQKFCNYCGAEMKDQEKNKNIKIFLPIGAGCICILVIMVAVFVMPKTTPASKLQAKLDLGNKYLAEANYEKAEIAFSEALKIDEKSPAAAMGLADTYNKQKKPYKAAQYLAKASDNVKNMKLSDAEEYAKKLSEQKDYYEKLIKDINEKSNNNNKTEGEIIIQVIQDVDNDESEDNKIFTTPTPTPEITEEPTPEETPTPEITEEPTPEEIPAPEITEEPVAEETPIPEITEEPVPEETVLPGEILISYANEVVLSQSPYASFDGSAISYDYGNGAGSAAALNGTLGMECTDLNGDGMEELLVISMKSGKIAFDVYEVEGESVVLKGSGTADTGFEGAVEGAPYSGTQECFIKENGGTYYVGIVCHYVGTNAGDGNPCTRTFAWIYSIGADGTPSGIASGSCADGADTDSFSSGVSPAGLSGSWAGEGLDNPGLLSGGLSSVESGVEDLVIVTGSMEAGSGSMSMSIEDTTILEN
ncbi:MAG: hypothetical protein Q4B37_04130 [Eubacteriales bacterium]|nr:hypothetical protein [Eubacteriales bacterium]